MKGSNFLRLALGFAVATSPAYAQTVQQFSSSTTEVRQPAVIDSYMKPTAFKTTEEVDENGQAHTMQEPMIWERHEKVVLPVVNREVNTEVIREPERRETKVSSINISRKVCSSYRPHKRFYAAHRAEHRAIAYRSAASRSTVSSTEVRTKETTTESPMIIERRDPALDLY